MTGVSPRTTASMKGCEIGAIWPAGTIRTYTSTINRRSAAYSCGTRRNAAIRRRSNRIYRTLRRKRSKTPGYNWVPRGRASIRERKNEGQVKNYVSEHPTLNGGQG